jgi:hypothetical protein
MTRALALHPRWLGQFDAQNVTRNIALLRLLLRASIRHYVAQDKTSSARGSRRQVRRMPPFVLPEAAGDSGSAPSLTRQCEGGCPMTRRET